MLSISSIYRNHGITAEDGEKIRNYITENIDLWKKEKVLASFIDSEDQGLPAHLFITHESEAKSVKVIIMGEDSEIGKGRDLTYHKVLDSSTFESGAMGIILFEEDDYRGIKRTKKERLKTAERVYKNFRLIKGLANIIQLQSVFRIHLVKPSVKGLGFLTPYYPLGDLKNYYDSKGALSKRDIHQISLDVSNALMALHEKLDTAHNDVKLENILLSRNSEGAVTAVLGDPGFIGPFEGHGTPRFFPPIYWMAYPTKKYNDFNGKEFDMWAFANVISFMVSGDYFIPKDKIADIEENKTIKNPYLALKNEFEMTIYPEYDESEVSSLDKVVRHIFQLDPKDRPESMRAVRAEILNINDS